MEYTFFMYSFVDKSKMLEIELNGHTSKKDYISTNVGRKKLNISLIKESLA